MCGRFALAASKEELERSFDIQLEQYRPCYNIAPSQDILLIIAASERRHPVWCRWGLRRQDGSLLINIRSETIREKPLFRRLLDCQRGIVPITGFYEWARRKPYFITTEAVPLVGLAALYLDDQDYSTGEVVRRCAILTRAADPAIAHVHHRMPVIVPPAAYADWLSGGRDGSAALEAVLQTLLPPLRYYAVSAKVGNPANDDPSVIEPLEAHQRPLL